jgi:hypothetical protein
VHPKGIVSFSSEYEVLFSGCGIVAGVKDRETNKVKAEVVNFRNTEALQAFVLDNTTEGAHLFKDEAAAYRCIARDQLAVKRSVGKYVKGQAPTNGMESFWAMMKRGYHGVYHHMSPQAPAPLRV